MTILGITGKRFGRLVALKPIGPSDVKGSRGWFWLCICDCGKYKEVNIAYLNRGSVRSCGCLHIESAIRMGHGNRIEFGKASFNQVYHTYKKQAKGAMSHNDFKLWVIRVYKVFAEKDKS